MHGAGARQVPRTPPYPLPCLSPERRKLSLGALLQPCPRSNSTPQPSRIISSAMGERKRKIVWEVIRLRARGEYIGTVSAPDQQAALKAAVKAFELNATEVERLLVRPCR